MDTDGIVYYLVFSLPVLLESGNPIISYADDHNHPASCHFSILCGVDPIIFCLSFLMNVYKSIKLVSYIQQFM